MIKQAPYIKKGDWIGITCPAGYMTLEKAQTCINTLQQWGYQVMLGKTVGSASTNYFSGTDEERLHELQAMLDDERIRVILCGRGGYGTGRIIDRLDFTRFKKNPKWIIGYSDITVLHAHVHRNLRIATLHAHMAAAFNEGGGANPFIRSLHDAIRGKKANYRCEAHPLNRIGEASGELVGGNLSLLSSMIGTPSEPETRNKLLFVEDIGEHIYSLDRKFWQLKRSGKLKSLRGLIVGSFADTKDTERPFGSDIYSVIYDLVKEYRYPVCFGFPCGHTNENLALKVGGAYSLNVGKKVVRLSELLS
jgi:muramoyltetrapeptide carboxypeptidase